MGTGYYWINLDKKERILPQLNGHWCGYKWGEWIRNEEFVHELLEYIRDNWSGDRIGIYSEYKIEDMGWENFKDIIIDGIPLKKDEKK